MTSTITWQIGHYNRSGVAQNSVDYEGSNNNAYLKHATDLHWTMPLNGIDQFDFALYLDDPAFANVQRKQSIIRVWRNINDTAASKTRTPSSGTPDFTGIVTSRRIVASENKAYYTAMSPLWLLQVHFHLLNHRLVKDSTAYGDPTDYEGGNTDNLAWDQSALMFRLIDLINGAFNDSGGDTGIRRPATRDYSGTPGSFVGTGSGSHFWPKTVSVSPYFVEKGIYTWANVFEDLMNRPGAPDIVPQYIYTASSKNLMYFKTLVARGTNRFSTFSFDYRTGNKNLDDIEESATINPGQSGNFVWVVGDGGPNGGVLAEASDATDISNNGIYMVRKDVKGSRPRDVTALIAPELKRAMANDDEIYTISISPLTSTYYMYDYFLGDVIKLNATKGNWTISNKKQRIYQVEMTLSDTNVEKVTAQISNDFKVKFP